MSFVRPPGPSDRSGRHAGPVRPAIMTARLTTSIWFSNWAGQVHFALVLIPHKIFLRRALRRFR